MDNIESESLFSGTVLSDKMGNHDEKTTSSAKTVDEGNSDGKKVQQILQTGDHITMSGHFVSRRYKTAAMNLLYGWHQEKNIYRHHAIVKSSFNGTVLPDKMGNHDEKTSLSLNTLGDGNCDRKKVGVKLQGTEDSLLQNELHIIMFGKAGSGKSSLGNYILGLLNRCKEYIRSWRPAEKRSLDIFIYGTSAEAVDTPGSLFSVSDSKIVADMQKMRVLKQNGLLEEELNWQDTSFIADNLYMGGHLNYLECKQIQDMSQPRRKAVEILIDAIIGNPSAVSAFIRILESESRFSYIAEKITRTRIAAAELERVLTEDHLFQSWETNQILNNKRKCLSFACEYPAAQKRMKINESEAVKEKKMVKSLRIAIVGQKLWNQVSKHLDPEFKEAFKGPFEDEE